MIDSRYFAVRTSSFSPKGLIDPQELYQMSITDQNTEYRHNGTSILIVHR